MDIVALKEAGLTDGETRVYLALLELGASTIGPILEKSSITRSIIYRILEKLIQKGLVSYIIKEKTKYYQASAPSKLLDYVESREKQLQINKNKIQEMIPQLILKQKLAKKSEANIYEGFKGLMTAYENRYLKLKAGDEVVLYGLPSKQPEFYHAYWQKANAKLDKLGIKSRLLYHPDVTDENLNSLKDLCKEVMKEYKTELLIEDDWGKRLFAQASKNGSKQGHFLYFMYMMSCLNNITISLVTSLYKKKF